MDLTSRVRQAELEISTGNAITDFTFVEEIKPDYPLIILDAIKILNGKGTVSLCSLASVKNKNLGTLSVNHKRM